MANRISNSLLGQRIEYIKELFKKKNHAPASSASLELEIANKLQELEILYSIKRKSVTDDEKTFMSKLPGLLELLKEAMEGQLFKNSSQFNQTVSEFTFRFCKYTKVNDIRYNIFHRKKGRETDTTDNNDKKDKDKKKLRFSQGLQLPTSSKNRKSSTTDGYDADCSQGLQLPTSSKNRKSSTTDGYDADCSQSKLSIDDNRSNDIRQEDIPKILEIKYEELKHATDNWSNANLIGSGGFGSVFKALWRNLRVAVKKLRNTDVKNKELVRELSINNFRHDNIVPIYGYSCKGSKVCIVYQLLVGGSLNARLHCRDDDPPLTWLERFKIILGTARGLDYLHTILSKPLIHGDIKPANILLDECITPKIADFGLARIGPHKDSRTHLTVSKVGGTYPYLPDDYIRSKYLCPAVDVFSFGVMIMELATGLKPIDKERPVPRLTDFIREELEKKRDTALYEDRRLYGKQQSNPRFCREFIDIGILCTRLQRSERPEMKKVYERLDSLMASKNYSD